MWFSKRHFKHIFQENTIFSSKIYPHGKEELEQVAKWPFFIEIWKKTRFFFPWIFELRYNSKCIPNEENNVMAAAETKSGQVILVFKLSIEC